LNTMGSDLLYSTYLGGTQQSSACCETALGIAVDRFGHAYVTGVTTSFDFPTTASAFAPSYHINRDSGTAVVDAFVTKLDPAQTGAASLIYSTYLGGSLGDAGRAIAVDDAGNAYVAGITGAGPNNDFPTTTHPFQLQSDKGGKAFIAKLDPAQAGAASLIYSTYLGGTSDAAQAFGIAVDNVGHVYVVGKTLSGDFPTKSPDPLGAFQTAKAAPGT